MFEPLCRGRYTYQRRRRYEETSRRMCALYEGLRHGQLGKDNSEAEIIDGHAALDDWPEDSPNLPAAPFDNDSRRASGIWVVTLLAP